MPPDAHATTPTATRRGLDVVRVGAFGGVSTLPLRLAEARNLFRRHGLFVELDVTPSSDALATSLGDGTHQVVHAAPDNFIAWSDRSGVPVDAWLGGSNGPITLVSRLGPDVSALRGARIGVDSPTSGFAPILRRLLALGNLHMNDIELVATGATRHRAAALANGAIDASMLTLPWSAAATAAGAARVGDHLEVAAHLQTSAAGSLRTWLAARPDIADRYGLAVVDAVGWLRDPAEHDAALAFTAADLNVDESLAEAILTTMTGPAGWPPTGAIDLPGMIAVCALREEVLGPSLRPLESYVDFGPNRRSNTEGGR